MFRNARFITRHLSIHRFPNNASQVIRVSKENGRANRMPRNRSLFHSDLLTACGTEITGTKIKMNKQTDIALRLPLKPPMNHFNIIEFLRFGNERIEILWNDKNVNLGFIYNSIKKGSIFQK